MECRYYSMIRPPDGSVHIAYRGKYMPSKGAGYHRYVYCGYHDSWHKVGVRVEEKGIDEALQARGEQFEEAQSLLSGGVKVGGVRL